MRCCLRSAVTALVFSQAVAAAAAQGQRTTLDRVALAVDGAESSHGSDAAMWRDDLTGPQGPMQVSAAAATDVGGGDRFDAAENRTIGRAYLARLYWRYGNWPDAIAAYNWGIGNMNAWVDAGRPPAKLVTGVAAYLGRVLHDSGLCDDAAAPRTTGKAAAAGRYSYQTPLPKRPAADAPISGACVDFAAWSEAPGPGRPLFGGAGGRFYGRLDKAMHRADQRLPEARRP
jgi:hypothetical protein